MKNWRAVALTLVMAGLMVLCVDRLVLRGVYAWAVSTPAYRAMAVELAVVYLLLALSLCTGKRTGWKLAAVGLIRGFFLWCHGALLPMAAAGLYLAYICGAGYLLRHDIFRLEAPEGAGYGADFLLGASGIITLYALLSAAGIGAVPILRLVAVLSGLVMAVLFAVKISRQADGLSPGMRRVAARLFGGEEHPLSGARAWQRQDRTAFLRRCAGRLMLAFILLMFLLQAGRMAISLDHDTLWYLVRSEYMLDNGPRGIYENMGTVSLVYTYPKGWEVLTLPLCDLPSHSFLQAFNLWVTALVLYTAYRIARQYMEPGYARLVPFLLSGIPGIMNMGISGKTDNITLLLQLLIVLYMVHFLKDRRPSRLPVSLGALFLSWTMKPTAVVFSTAVFGVSVLYLAWIWIREDRAGQWNGADHAGRWNGVDRPERHSRSWSGAWPRWRTWASVCLPAAALGLIWYRTYLFVGVPVTSIFSGIFQKLGCEIRYPFLVWDLPDYGAKPTFTEELLQLAERLWGVFILPEAQDMSRVLISWCSLTVVFFGLLWLTSLPDRGWRTRREGTGQERTDGPGAGQVRTDRFRARLSRADRPGAGQVRTDGSGAKMSRIDRSETDPERTGPGDGMAVQRDLLWYGRSLLIVLGLASVYSIYSLKQVDGNYFILFYTLTVVSGCAMIARLGWRAGVQGTGKRFRRQIAALLLLLTLFNSLMVSLSNLSWSVGLTPFSLSGPAVWDHEEEAYKSMAEKGNEQIWAVLGADRENRAIAFGEHLEVLSFPCNVQSYTDISSSSGNEYLVEDVGAFKAYMAYAKTEYVYVEAGYMAEAYQGFGLLRECIRAGILTDLLIEDGNILADVDLEGEPGPEADAQLEAFDRGYIVKED